MFEYLRMDDEIQINRLVYAIVRAFNGDKVTPKKPVDDDEEVIDTTKPEFAEQFKGFTNAPPIRQTPQQTFPQRGTQIIMG